MRYPFPRQCAAVLLFLVLPLAVLCCEDECQRGVTNAYVGNYSSPLHAAMLTINKRILLKMLPKQNYPLLKTSMDYTAPILTAYHEKAPAALQAAIFPGFFHGKCQRDAYAANGSVIGNVDPPGCPNPDCPVVCGTPGSMCHYFSTLRRIAFNATMELLRGLCAPESEAYQQVETGVFDAQKNPRYARRGAADMKSKELQAILQGIPGEVEKACGSGLSACSWEQAMKAYIGSFP